MTTRIKPYALQLAIAYLAHLKGGVHVAVDVVLLFGHFNVLFRRDIDLISDIGVDILPVGILVPTILHHETSKKYSKVKLNLKVTNELSSMPSIKAWYNDLF
jgi:hypothetical protein